MNSRSRLEIINSLNKIASSLESLGMIKHADVIERVMTKLSQEKDTWFPSGPRPKPGDSRYLPPLHSERSGGPLGTSRYFDPEIIGDYQVEDTIPRIIEMDQWHSDELVRGLKRGKTIPFEVVWDDNEALSKITGGDTEAIKQIFGGNLNRLTDIFPDKKPPIGMVWFKESDDGNLELYKSNYDSSD